MPEWLHVHPVWVCWTGVALIFAFLVWLIAQFYVLLRRRRPSAVAIASARLASDLGLPADRVSGILCRTTTDLRKLSTADQDDFDARPIIDRAVHELSELGFHPRPAEEAIMDRYLQEMPDRDYQILRYFKQGKKHREIAEQLGTNVDAVRSSLVKTYAELRMRILSSNDGGLHTPTTAQAVR